MKLLNITIAILIFSLIPNIAFAAEFVNGNFETGDFTGWNISSNADTPRATLVNYSTYGSVYGNSTADLRGSSASDTDSSKYTAISQDIDFSLYDDLQYTMRYEHYPENGGGSYSITVVHEGGQIYSKPFTGSQPWTTYHIDISSYEGTGYIRFASYTIYGNRLIVDNIYFDNDTGMYEPIPEILTPDTPFTFNDTNDIDWDLTDYWGIHSSETFTYIESFKCINTTFDKYITYIPFYLEGNAELETTTGTFTTDLTIVDNYITVYNSTSYQFEDLLIDECEYHAHVDYDYYVPLEGWSYSSLWDSYINVTNFTGLTNESSEPPEPLPTPEPTAEPTPTPTFPEMPDPTEGDEVNDTYNGTGSLDNTWMVEYYNDVNDTVELLTVPLNSSIQYMLYPVNSVSTGVDNATEMFTAYSPDNNFFIGVVSPFFHGIPTSLQGFISFRLLCVIILMILGR